MPLSQITSRLVKVSGDPLVNCKVVARLRPVECFLIDTGDSLASKVSTTTDSNGDWTLNLERNSNITPTGTYWEITERVPGMYGGDRVRAVVVGDSTATLAESGVSTAPAIRDPEYVTVEIGDARWGSPDFMALAVETVLTVGENLEAATTAITDSATAASNAADSALAASGFATTAVNAANAVQFSAAAIGSTVTQSIPNTTSTTLVLATEEFDVGNWHDGSPANTFTVPAGVSYVELVASATFAASVVGARYMFFSKNGTAIPRILSSHPATATTPSYLNLSSGPIPVAEGDNLTLSVWQSSGGLLDVTGARFSVNRLG